MTYFLVFATSLLVSLVAGAVVRRVALHYGAVVPLRPDRWHRHPTPTFGGIALVLGIAAGLAVQRHLWIPEMRVAGMVLGVGAALFAIGWYDDVRPFTAIRKVVNSLAAAGFFVFVLSYATPSFGAGLAGAVLSLAAVLAFAGLDNAVNLLDNMDGLAAGLVAIAAAGLAVTFPDALGPALVAVLAALAGALVGFLAWNHAPARLFMGNCGSLAIGGLLAACAIVAAARTGTLQATAAAALILIAPIFDTSFVILLRRLARRSTTAGNVDHTSHRLVSAGSSERRAVLILYALGGAGSVAGFLLHTRGAYTWPVAVGVALAAIILGLYLARVPAYKGQDFAALQDAPFASMLSELMIRWHLGEVLLDLVLITVCYYTAYYIRFEEQMGTFIWSFTASLPLIVGCQIAALYASGLYARAWSTFGFHDFWPVARGVGLGSMLAILVIAVTYKNTPEYVLFSRGVWLLEAFMLIAAIVLTRMSFRILGRVAAHSGSGKQRVLIYGAGARGQLLVREMLANPSWLRNPVAFIDDDHSKHGWHLLGVPVRASVDELSDVLKTLRVDEVLLSSPSINGTHEAQVREICGSRNIAVRRLHLELQ
jgi:UDP-GlcNAc:undecaprenyl-phosphate GlcNAc-1-phosphate transferase